ncbi:sigma-70 family RNA polymerase sigma factor [Algoriphagus resistens]|uniref:sigma-70 family RNA polymerase sigma factor n=1 Tax=Algoriphagus resistens TaxID=1750590 RepID=UPI000716962B|nr:sigma-70 family RNA polymerase sigma factor [Algoriphagus resistens]
MDILQNYQKKLFPFAYNILGSVDDAFDVIQDVVVNFLEGNRDHISNESAYLIKGVINKSINLKKRSRKTVGDFNWLPEPIGTENTDHSIATKEIISYSMLVLLEYLSPRERAVFILKNVFDYSHKEIAEVFSISVDNSKQLLHRAKKTLNNQGGDLSLKGFTSNDLLSKYVEVIKSGDVKKLEEMLSENIITHGEGGGKPGQALISIFGASDVAALLIQTFELHLRKFRNQFSDVNNSPAILYYAGSKLIACQIFEIEQESGKITNMYFVAGRKKLKGILGSGHLHAGGKPVQE